MRITIIFLIFASLCFCLLAGESLYFTNIVANIYQVLHVEDECHDPFVTVSIQSSFDGNHQKAIHSETASGSKQPLLVSLHTWSGDYLQEDPLAECAVEKDWNYIHPNFRGPNNSPEACLSNKVINDIDDAIDFAIKQGRVDKNNIFIVGVSGGGYATIGYFMKGKYNAKAYMAWAPITDLVKWYWQSVNSGNDKFVKDILNCTSGGSNPLNVYEVRKRSPMYWEPPPIKRNSVLEIYAGLNDGYSGTVPISHAILFYNKLLNYYKLKDKIIKEGDIINLLSRGVEVRGDQPVIEGRTVIYCQKTPIVSLTIFDGGHEMLPNYCMQRMEQLMGL